jgi:transposase
MRAHLAEYGFIAAKGISRLRDLLPLLDDGAGALPELARQTLLLMAQLIEALTIQIRKIETELLRWHRSNAASQRLETTPGIGFITATALAATVNDARFPVRTTIRRLARLGAAPELQRRQGAAGRDLQDGRPLSAAPAGHRRDRGCPLYPAQDNQHKPLSKPAT